LRPINKTLRNARTMEHKTGTGIARMIMNFMNLKEENLKKL